MIKKLVYDNSKKETKLLDDTGFNARQPTTEQSLNEYRKTLIVTPWQIRKALNQTGKRGAVNSFINTADQDTKDGWEVATSFERLHPMIVALGPELGLSEVEIDQLFELAKIL
ncbi:hypothetical protein KAR91_14880 [Candidatus Pacearchaeota archaeon]|nr:hypothetical protein [Candidatus Pacearchaeota archaeon]